MPRIVSEDIFNEPRHRPEKYPYDEWCDGKTRVFTRGKDFDLSLQPLHFSITVRKAMAKRGRSIRVHVIDENEVAIQVLPKWKNIK